MNESSHTIKIVLELALLAVREPLNIRSLRKVFAQEISEETMRTALSELGQDWEGRAFELIETASGFQFVSRPEYASYLSRLQPSQTPRLSRALMEILSIIAYHQPVTRGDIEKIRGVSCSASQFSVLEEQNWIEEIGRRETPGRPVLYATSKSFLDDLRLNSLQDLPPLEDIQSEITNNFEKN